MAHFTGTLTFVNNEKKVSKNGKPYTSASLKFQELGDVWVNGFGSKTTELWTVGNKITVDLYEEEYNGKVYKKFNALDKTDLLEMRVAKLEKMLQSPVKATPVEAGPDFSDLPWEDIPV